MRPALLRVREVDRRTESAIAALRRLPYQDYLQTAHWHRVRILAQMRPVPRAERELEVHHRNYARRGFEQSEDVIVLCRPCHQRHHGTLRLAASRPVIPQRAPLAPASGLRWVRLRVGD